MFFLVKEPSDRASTAGQVSQPVRACEPGDLSEPTAPAYFFGGKINVCRCHEFRSNSKNKVRHCENFSVIF